MRDESAERVGTRESTALNCVERAVVRTLVSELLADGAPALLPAEMFTAICEVMVGHFSLTSAGFYKQVAGKGRAFVWTAPSVASAGRIAARKHAWTSAAELLDASHLDAGEVASATVSDEQLGLSALLYVKSCRALDGGDRALLEDVLRRMLSSPGLDER